MHNSLVLVCTPSCRHADAVLWWLSKTSAALSKPLSEERLLAVFLYPSHHLFGAFVEPVEMIMSSVSALLGTLRRSVQPVAEMNLESLHVEMLWLFRMSCFDAGIC